MPDRAAGLDGAGRVLVAEDDPTGRHWLRRFFSARGSSVDDCADGLEAWSAFQARRHSLVLTDLRMPGIDGLELTRRVRGLDPSAVIIVTTAHASIEGTIEALRCGARDYLPKPFSTDHLEVVLARSSNEAVGATRAPARPAGAGSGIDREANELVIGSSPLMREAVDLVDRIAPTETVVLLRGETGTGKELLARRIHARSPRRERPFVRVNCGCISSTLADAQLFGSERGAYTSAVEQSIGMFESADGGSVFLDEIGDLPLDLQVKLLEFLQDRTYRRLGSSKVHRANVRVVLATHRDLEAMVREGSFRSDLYYRIRQIEVRLPPLRDRLGDLGELIDHVLKKAHPSRDVRLDNGAMDRAIRYPWPGNIRELEQAVLASTAMATGDVVRQADLDRALGLGARHAGIAPATSPDDLPPADASLEEVERWHIQRALVACGGNVSAVARKLGIDRSTIYRRILRKS